MKNAILILILLSFTQCKKDKDTEERRTGDKTVSFYLNGELWQNSSELGYGGSINGTGKNSVSDYGGLYGNIRYMAIEGNIWDNSKFLLMLIMDDSVNKSFVGNHDMDNSHGNLYPVWSYLTVNHMILKKNGVTYLSKKEKGWAYVTRKETENNINGLPIGHFEGRFEAILYNEKNPLDSLIITDGLWDN